MTDGHSLYTQTTTVLLIDGITATPEFMHAVMALLTDAAVTIPRPLLRMFLVSTKLIEFRERFEEFARFSGPKPPNFPAAVNRVNILKPTRIVIVAPSLSDLALGAPRPETLGYVWSLAPALADTPEQWRVLQCAPEQILALIERGELASARTSDAHVS